MTPGTRALRDIEAPSPDARRTMERLMRKRGDLRFGDGVDEGSPAPGYTPRGWDRASVAEFDRRWLAGEPIAEMAFAFRTSTSYICELRRRRGLPTRRGHDGIWRGGNRAPLTKAQRP